MHWNKVTTFALTLDAGMSHDPESMPRFQEHSHADLVIGYREKKVNVPFSPQSTQLGWQCSRQFCPEHKETAVESGTT